ncbi:MAG: VCBS repeat-containing protein [Bacteroidetes bacterium]|nr:VCBS repeat-containing protein [Bacteroidota bacterium]
MVANYSDNTISVFRNVSSSGSITSSSFATKVNFTTGTKPYSVAIGDLDGDGKLDLVVANYGSSTVSILRNTSSVGSITSSSFATKVDYTTASSPEIVAIGDLDGDGKPDLAVADYSSKISVLRNTSVSGSITSSSFAAKVDFATGGSTPTLVIADLDGDGKPELIASNSSSNTISVFRNVSSSGSITSSSFAAKVDFTTGTTPVSLAIGDLDGDGKLDLVAANYGSSTVSILRNTSSVGSITSSSFATKVDFTTGNGPQSVAIGDLDGDGKPDLAVANFNLSSTTVSIFRNTSVSGSITSSSFATKVDFATGVRPISVAIGDLDGDGISDLAVANFTSNTLSIFHNNPAYTWYSSAAGATNLQTNTNWGFNSDGSGVNPTDFTNSNHTFQLANGSGGNYAIVGAWSVAGNVNIPTGATLALAANNISLGGNLSNAGTISGIGNLILNGNLAQTINGTGTVSNLTINNSNGVTIGAIGTAQTVTGTITPTNGTLTTNGNLILASSSNANASIAQGSNTGNYISGNVTVQRYIGSSAQWRMIGFPFTSATTISQATLSGFFSSGYNAYTYNEANDDKTHYGNSGAANAGWTQFTSGTTSSKNGILLKGGTPSSTISFTGPINAGNSSAIISLTKTQNGWNFIANPFPSNINWTSILTNNSSVLNNAIYRYDPNSTAYASYVGGSSTGNQTNVIENGAGFFVQAKTAGSIAIQESDKTTSTAVSLMGNEPAIGTLNPNGSTTPTNTNSIIKLSLAKQGDKYADEVVLRWGVAADATDKFDGKYDAYDMGRRIGPDLSVIGNDSTVYSIFHGSELKNNSDENRTVQLGIKNMEEGNYTIGIQLLSLIANNNKAYLYDSYTGVYTLIDGNTNSYGFITTSDIQSQKSTRFSIVLNAKGTEADNNNLPVILLNNPSNNNQFSLFSKSNYSQLQYQVIDNAGRVLNAGMFNNVLKGSVYNINAANAVQGHYFIKLIGNGSLLPTLNAVKN